MGLDMYLYADIYVSKDEFTTAGKFEENPKYKELVKVLDLDEHVMDGYGFTVHAPIGVWRKANAIHNWFVNKLAGGLDQCQEITVYQDRLTELKVLCEKVLTARSEEVSNELLPTASGFFFGSTEFDDWYYKDIEQTVKIIDNAVALPHTERFIYRASW